MADRSELKQGELHPAAFEALNWINKLPLTEKLLWQGAFASCAIESNRLAEVCSGTLHRVMTGQPVGERYILGLVYAMTSQKREEMLKHE